MTLREHLRIFCRAVKWFYGLSKTYMLCTVGVVLIGAVMPYIPIYFSARVIDALYASAPLEEVAVFVVLTVGLVFLFSLLRAWLQSKASVVNHMVYRSLAWEKSEKTMTMSYVSIEDRDVARLRDRIQEESQTGYNLFYLERFFTEGIHALAHIVIAVCMLMPLFAAASIPMLVKCCLMGGVGVTVLCAFVTTRKSAQVEMKKWDMVVDYNARMNTYYDYVNHYGAGKDIRLYDMAGLLKHVYFADVDGSTAIMARSEKSKLFMGLAYTCMEHLLKFGVYLLLIAAALQGGITVGSIAQYVSSLMLLLAAITLLVRAVQGLLSNNVYLKRYFSYFDIPNDMIQGSLTVEKRDDNEYFVEFRDVSFRYPNTDAYALRHVSLKFKVGEKLAIVGMNGSGKTTFIKLLCRLYDPTEGEIFLNSVNIQKYDYDEYMSLFSVVFQDFRLFSFSLAQNVATSMTYDADRVETCLQKAGFAERLASMPEGIETPLYRDFDENGIEISGGEAQKIALARALYKDAPFILLDEPTAALDPVAEYEVYAHFNAISGEKTAVYISHRLASCRFCDTIAVFDHGGIVQTGNHEALLADKSGKYYELWTAQAQYYTEDS